GFTRSGGIVNLGGTLELDGGKLTLTPGTGSWNLTRGVVRSSVAGGTIASTGDAALVLTNDGGTLVGGLSLANGPAIDASNGRADIQGGLTLNGTLTLGGPGTAGSLNFQGSQTLNGSGTVLFAGSKSSNSAVGSGTIYASSSDGGTTPAILTIGSGIT